MCLFFRRVIGLSVSTFTSNVPLHRLASNNNSFCMVFPPCVQHWYCFLNLIFGPVFDIFFTQTVFVICENSSTHSSHKKLKSSLSRGICVRNFASKNFCSDHVVWIMSKRRSILDKICSKSDFACCVPAILFTKVSPCIDRGTTHPRRKRELISNVFKGEFCAMIEWQWGGMVGWYSRDNLY